MAKKTTDQKIDELTKIVKTGFADASKDTDRKISELAQMTARGFSELEEKMDKRFGEVDKRFEQMEKKFNERFDRVEFWVSGHDRQIDVLNDKVRQLAVKVGLKFN